MRIYYTLKPMQIRTYKLYEWFDAEPKQTRGKKNTECNSHPAPLNNETYLNGFNDDSF